MFGPIGATPVVPWVINAGYQAERPFLERKRHREEQEAAQRAIALQLMQSHRTDYGAHR